MCYHYKCTPCYLQVAIFYWKISGLRYIFSAICTYLQKSTLNSWKVILLFKNWEKFCYVPCVFCVCKKRKLLTLILNRPWPVLLELVFKKWLHIKLCRFAINVLMRSSHVSRDPTEFILYKNKLMKYEQSLKLPEDPLYLIILL